MTVTSAKGYVCIFCDIFWRQSGSPTGSRSPKSEIWIHWIIELPTNFDEILWRAGVWPRDQLITFWWWSASRSGSGHMGNSAETVTFNCERKDGWRSITCFHFCSLLCSAFGPKLGSTVVVDIPPLGIPHTQHFALKCVRHSDHLPSQIW